MANAGIVVKPKDALNLASTGSDSLIDSLIMIAANSPIGKKLKANGFDILEIKKILDGDEKAINKFANEKGFPPPLLKAIRAITLKDNSKL